MNHFHSVGSAALKVSDDVDGRVDAMVGVTDCNPAEDRILTTQEELRREKDRLRLLLDLNNAVVSNLDLLDLLRAISASVRRVMQCDAVAVLLADSQSDRLRLYGQDCPDGNEPVPNETLYPVEGRLLRMVLRSRKPWVGNVSEVREQAENDGFLARGLRSGCALPLVSHGRVLGVLALACADEGAFTPDVVDFLTQIGNQVAIAVENALAHGEIAELKDKLAQENLYLADEIRHELNFEQIIGKSAVLQRVLKDIERVAKTESTVIIYGETGTGKELVARAIHDLSDRHAGAFVKLNCAAIPTGLLESELFGHEKGAFTGAIAQRLGRFELANGGTIFLDEIGDIPLELQPKLLRVLQEREFERLGGARTLGADARLITATNRDLEVMVADRVFRSDLFYRLNVFPIYVPALRERPGDIPLLVRHFVQQLAHRMNKSIESIPCSVMRALCQYHWPGNIRELQNVIERAVILSPGHVLNVNTVDLKRRGASVVGSQEGQLEAPTPKQARSAIEHAECDEIISALRGTNGRVGGPNGAAARLGLKRTTLISRMAKLGIHPGYAT